MSALDERYVTVGSVDRECPTEHAPRYAEHESANRLLLFTYALCILHICPRSQQGHSFLHMTHKCPY